MRKLLVALLTLVTACVAEVRPPPRALSAQEAVNIATRYARSRGLVVDTTRDARQDGYGNWQVALGGAGGRDSAFVLLDGYSGRVITARVTRKSGAYLVQPGPPGAPSEAPPPETPPPAPSEARPPREESAPHEIPGPPPPPEAAPEPPATPGPTPTD